MPKKATESKAKVAVTSSAIVMRKKRDGTISLVSGEFPEEHEFSTRALGRIVTEGQGRVLIEMNMTNGRAEYEVFDVTRADPENADSATTAYKVRRVAGKKEVKVIRG